MAAYDRVAAGGGPEVEVVLGESGLGKTRLVQEFFARLSAGIDNEGDGGYWPDRLVRDTNNLKINPDPVDCNPSRVADMRFLWWGIRMPDASAVNAGSGGVTAAAPFLRAHLEPFARARLLSARIAAAAKNAAIDVAVEVGNLFTFGLLGLGKLGLDHAAEIKDILDSRFSAAASDPGSAGESQRKSLVDTVIADLDALFEASADKGTLLPAIVLLDDAQWLAEDRATSEFFARLLEAAREHDWPLLVLATHWEKEWHDHRPSEGADTFAKLAEGFVRPDWKPLKLGREPGLSDLIAAGFPGLTTAQRELLLEKADGNPLVLDELMRGLLTSRGHFRGRDTAGPLTEAGERAVRETSVSLHTLVARRLAKAPDAVQVAVALSGVQGLRFLSRITSEAAQIVGGPECGAALEEAESPHAIIASLERGLAEFSQRVFYEVARERAPHIVDPGAAAEAIRKVLRRLAGEEAEFPTLAGEEREVAWQLGAEMFGPDGGSDLDWDDRALGAWCCGRLAFRPIEQGPSPVLVDLPDFRFAAPGNPDRPLSNREKFLRAYRGGGIDDVGASHTGQRIIAALLHEEGGWDLARPAVESLVAGNRRDWELDPSEHRRRNLVEALHDQARMLLHAHDQFVRMFLPAGVPEMEPLVDEAMALIGDSGEPFWLDQLRFWGMLRGAILLRVHADPAAVEMQRRVLAATEALIDDEDYPDCDRFEAASDRGTLGDMLMSFNAPEEAFACFEQAAAVFGEFGAAPRYNSQVISMIDAGFECGRKRAALAMADQLVAAMLRYCEDSCGAYGTGRWHSNGCTMPMDFGWLAAVVRSAAGDEAALPFYRRLLEAICDADGDVGRHYRRDFEEVSAVLAKIEAAHAARQSGETKKD
ncbi:hypothetical protein I5L01_04320 [Erythrobacter sp. YJ-T3-07]|nr:hypothetical protein [Erythrobacter sp. YJ-T3-07]